MLEDSGRLASTYLCINVHITDLRVNVTKTPESAKRTAHIARVADITMETHNGD